MVSPIRKYAGAIKKFINIGIKASHSINPAFIVGNATYLTIKVLSPPYAEYLVYACAIVASTAMTFLPVSGLAAAFRTANGIRITRLTFKQI